MISSKFVKLSREVIKFIRNGNKLRALGFDYDYKTKSACALGAVLYNNKELPQSQLGYTFITNYLGLGFDFMCGFDDGIIGLLKVELMYVSANSEEYQLGYRFAKMCRKRNWTY